MSPEMNMVVGVTIGASTVMSITLFLLTVPGWIKDRYRQRKRDRQLAEERSLLPNRRAAVAHTKAIS